MIDKQNSLILKCENIYKSYFSKKEQATEVLKGISLEIKRGDSIALVGPSGAGKSTLLHVLGSLDTSDQGEIVFFIENKNFNFKNMSSTERDSFRNKKIGFVFQFHHLLPEFTCLENVMMPALIGGETFSEAKTKAEKLLSDVGLEQRKKHKPAQLSGGEQQRTAIARAVINQPEILFADEPTGNLDSQNAEDVLNIFNRMKTAYNLTLIIATHSQEIANSTSRIITIRDGVVH